MAMLFGLFGIEPIHSKAESTVTELLVEYAEGARMTFSEEVEGQVEERKKVSPEVELWSLTEDTDVEKLQRQLQSDPTVLYVESNVERELTADATDPEMQAQWWLPHVRSEAIWSRVYEQKMQVSVAVIDSGLDIKHNDLNRRIRADGYNFYNDNNNVFDETGHGTKVAGVIAAEYGNGIGVTGIAGPFDVKVLPLKVFGATSKTKVSYIVAAIDYALSRDIDVINLSFGGPIKSDIENNALQRAIAAGITVVAAAGNEGEKGNQEFYPASYDNVISVGGVDELNRHVKSSNFSEKISLVAPGTFIYTTLPYNQYGFGEGTSFSAPIVAGTAAILKSLQPEKTPQQIKKLLQDTSTPLIDSGNIVNFGSGVLNLNALHQALSPKKIPVERVELNAEAVTMDLSLNQVNVKNSSSFIQVNYEQEPNNTFKDANWFYTNSKMLGTITKSTLDMDYYRFRIDSPVVLELNGRWSNKIHSRGEGNKYLFIHLYDEQLNRIGQADYQILSESEKSRHMLVALSKGDYYLEVSQSNEHDIYFANQEYELTNVVKKSDLVDEMPNFLENVNMRVNEEKSFATDQELYRWTSSDSKVATVNKDGLVHALTTGATTIESFNGRVKKTYFLTVTDINAPVKVKLNESVFPSNATDSSVMWSSSDPSIAEVDQNGMVTAKEVGTVFITAIARLGGVSEIATVNVVRNGKGYEFTSDFENQDVSPGKVFRITFTQPLSPFKDYSQDLVLSREANGAKRVKEFTARVNPLNYKQLLIEPSKSWQEGYHYLTVTKNVQNTNLLSLTKESRIMFYSYYK